VLDFRLVTNDLGGLARNGHLFFTLWDYDVTNDDDLIGTAVIELDRIIKVAFTLPLFLTFVAFRGKTNRTAYIGRTTIAKWFISRAHRSNFIPPFF
jgi:hypothetical protein